MEYYRSNLLVNVATGIRKRFVVQWYAKKKEVSSFKKKKWVGKFHKWRMDWNSLEIKLYVDDYLMDKVPLDSLYNPNGGNSLQTTTLYFIKFDHRR